jgi:protein O-mannosyl-transferase
MTGSKTDAMNWNELSHSIADRKNDGTRYAFLLGAGASISSKIPGAKKLASDWLEVIKENNSEAYKNLKELPEYDEDNLAPLYPEIYRTRFKVPEDGYRAIEEIMSDDKKVWPNIGYSILAQVMNKTRHNLVLTTNFDRLTEMALLFYENVHARVIAHETMLDVVSIDDKKPSIVKIHRDMFCSPMSAEEEIENLSKKWAATLKEILANYHVVAIGYGGNDGGLMTMLETALKETPKARIHWCHIGDNPDKFPQFRQQVLPVKIPSFDGMMHVLGGKLGYSPLGEQIIKDAEQRQKVYDSEITKVVAEISKGDDKDVTDAVTKLVAHTWWEVELGVQKTNNPDEKEALYQHGITEFPDSHELLGNYANFLYETRKDYEKADQFYQQILKADPDDVTAIINYAIFLYQVRKENDRAEQFYKRVLKMEPDHVNANRSYAIFLDVIRKDYDQAEKFYRKALKADPGDANINCSYAGFLYEIRKDNDQAEQFYKRALKVEPGHVSANGSYANFLYQVRKDNDQAEKFYQKALKADPGDANINCSYAIFLYEIRKDNDQAEQFYQRALKVEPDHVNANSSYAIFLHEIRKENDQAEKFFQKALKADSGDANINGNYAGFLLASGRITEAIPFLEQAESYAEDNDLRLELHFYRLAHFPDRAQASRQAIDELLVQGARSPSWDLTRNIERAELDGCEYVEELRELAQKIGEDS